MKKEKIVLTLITVTTFFCSTLAFKANHRTGVYYCTNTTSTLDPSGLPVSCTVRATIGPAYPTLGRCGFGGSGSYSFITRWAVNQ